MLVTCYFSYLSELVHILKYLLYPRRLADLYLITKVNAEVRPNIHQYDPVVGYYLYIVWSRKMHNVSKYLYLNCIVFMSADLSVSWHYVVTLRRGRTRTREQLLLQNYKA